MGIDITRRRLLGLFGKATVAAAAVAAPAAVAHAMAPSQSLAPGMAQTVIGGKLVTFDINDASVAAADTMVVAEVPYLNQPSRIEVVKVRPSDRAQPYRNRTAFWDEGPVETRLGPHSRGRYVNVLGKVVSVSDAPTMISGKAAT